MHVHGHGSAADLARSARPALDLIDKGAPPSAKPASAPKLELDAASLDKIVGRKGDTLGSVYKYTVGR